MVETSWNALFRDRSPVLKIRLPFRTSNTLVLNCFILVDRGYHLKSLLCWSSVVPSTILDSAQLDSFFHSLHFCSCNKYIRNFPETLPPPPPFRLSHVPVSSNSRGSWASISFLRIIFISRIQSKIKEKNWTLTRIVTYICGRLANIKS